MLTHVQLPRYRNYFWSMIRPSISTSSTTISASETISASRHQMAFTRELLEQEPERFSAVVLDRMMPEMDGMEVP